MGISVLFINSTRTWLVLCIIFSIVFLYLNRNKENYHLTWIVYLPLLAGIVVVLLKLLHIHDYFNFKAEDILLSFERFASLFRNLVFAEIDSSLYSRFHKWDQAFQIALENPIWGVGLEKMNLNMGDWINPLGNKRADNQFIDLFAMTGIGGVVTFTLFEAGIIKKLYSSLYINLPIFSLLFSIASLWFLAGCFWAILYGYSGIFHTFFLSVCLYSISREANI